MKVNDYIIQKFEVDQRRFVYGNFTSITFSEIENEIKIRTNRLNISVYGEYDYKSNIEPFVYLQASYEGYKLRILLSKQELNRESANRYYDYLADNIIHQFGEKLFRG